MRRTAKLTHSDRTRLPEGVDSCMTTNEVRHLCTMVKRQSGSGLTGPAAAQTSTHTQDPLSDSTVRMISFRRKTELDQGTLSPALFTTPGCTCKRDLSGTARVGLNNLRIKQRDTGNRSLGSSPPECRSRSTL